MASNPYLTTFSADKTHLKLTPLPLFVTKGSDYIFRRFLSDVVDSKPWVQLQRKHLQMLRLGLWTNCGHEADDLWSLGTCETHRRQTTQDVCPVESEEWWSHGTALDYGDSGSIPLVAVSKLRQFSSPHIVCVFRKRH